MCVYNKTEKIELKGGEKLKVAFSPIQVPCPVRTECEKERKRGVDSGRQMNVAVAQYTAEIAYRSRW